MEKRKKKSKRGRTRTEWVGVRLGQPQRAMWWGEEQNERGKGVAEKRQTDRQRYINIMSSFSYDTASPGAGDDSPMPNLVHCPTRYTGSCSGDVHYHWRKRPRSKFSVLCLTFLNLHCRSITLEVVSSKITFLPTMALTHFQITSKYTVMETVMEKQGTAT